MLRPRSMNALNLVAGGRIELPTPGLGGTWNLIKDTAETPEEIREVVETMDRSKEYELERLKKQQIRMGAPGHGQGWSIDKKQYEYY